MDSKKYSSDLTIANDEIVLLNEEKEKRIAELKSAYQEISLQIQERGSRAAELAIANIELEFQNQEKEKLAAELIIANKELIFQNEEKEKRAAELLQANIELQKAEAAVRSLNAELEQKVVDRSAQYNFISQVNQTIVHVQDAESLFHHSCRIAFEFGNFNMAWIGCFNPTSETISIVDHSGVPTSELNLFTQIPYAQNVAQSFVMSTGNYYLCNDIKHSAELEEWKPFATKHNIGSLIVLPIKKSGVVYGTFNLYATEPYFFNEDNINLVVEVAGDISFALGTFEKAEKHKQAEALILKNEHRFRALIENSVDIKSLATVDGKRFYASPAVSKVLGYTSREFENTSFESTIHPDDLPSFLENLKEALKVPGSMFHSQHRLRHKDGRYIWCEGNITNMVDDPHVKAIVSNIRDISDTKKIEQYQEFSSSNLTALINNNSDLMWSVNKRFELITSNKAFDETVSMLSGNPVIAVGKSILDLNFPEEQLSLYKSYYERAFSGEAFAEIECTIHKGKETWSKISFNPIKKGKEVIGTACHSHDITELKRSEKQIKESEAFTLGILNSLNYHIAVIDESGEIVAVNEAWTQFALQNGETTLERTGVGSNYFSVCEKSADAGDETAGIALKGLKDVMSKREHTMFLEYACDSPTEKRWFALRAVKFDNDLPLIVIAHMEISERKIGEEEREKLVAEMVVRNRDLEQFTFIISHNLRAPTANIIGLTEILLDETLSSPQQKEFVQALSTSALGLDSVIKDINSILQLKNGFNETKELISFKTLVEEILNNNINSVSMSSARIETDFSAIDEIFSLKVYLHSIFYNLISNSIKYSKPGVQPHIEIKSRRSGRKIILSFKDNGLGIDVKTNGDKLFGLYKRFHSHVEGKGMGLFMVKTQLEAMGGSISVTSEVGKGTEFTIILQG